MEIVTDCNCFENTWLNMNHIMYTYNYNKYVGLDEFRVAHNI